MPFTFIAYNRNKIPKLKAFTASNFECYTPDFLKSQLFYVSVVILILSKLYERNNTKLLIFGFHIWLNDFPVHLRICKAR